MSGDTILRLIRSASLAPITPPRVVGIDDWAWRRGQRYGTIICDLERNRVIDLLPDRNADTVAAWLKRYPGVEIVARDRAGVYADGARRGAPSAVQVADRWHLLSNLGDTLRNVVGRHRRAVAAAGQAVAMAKSKQCAKRSEAARASPTTLDMLRQARRNACHDIHAEICRLRDQGLTPSHIAPIVGMDKRSVQRWLAAGGEPEHRRPPARSHLIDPFRVYLVQRWQEGCRVGEQLWREIKDRGYRGSRVTVTRWAAAYREVASPAGQATPIASAWKMPSRRRCAWLLSQDPLDLNTDEHTFLVQLFELAPELAEAGELARRFTAILRSDEGSELDPWISQAETSELAGLAKGIRRDIDAIRAAITHSWTTSPAEGQINRVKAIKRQMYGRGHYPLLRQRVLIVA